VALTRIQGPLPTETRMLEGNIGYILIPTLWDNTIVERVGQALQELATNGDMNGLVLDLRVNSGGSDAALMGLLALFADGELGRFMGRKGVEPLHVKGIDIGGSQHQPLVILVGRETASFAEVFSGALREAGRAHIVGRTTFGNVEITYGYDFEDRSRAWIAQETFRPPSGVDWEKTGIVPDVEIPLDWDEFTVEDDPQLTAALELLRIDTGN
jgi:carboxyl-terminal processing protease